MYIALYSVEYFDLINTIISNRTQIWKIWKQLVIFSLLHLPKTKTIGDQHQLLCTILSITDTIFQQLPPWIPTTMQTTRTDFGRCLCWTINLAKQRDAVSDLPPLTRKAVRKVKWILPTSQNKDAGSGHVTVWSTPRRRVGVALRASPAITWQSCPMDKSWESKIRTAHTVS